MECFCDPCTPLSEFEVEGRKITVERAPEPDDIIWENAGVSIREALLRKFGYSLLALSLLVLGGLGQYYIVVWEKNEEKDMVFISGLAGSMLVIVLNQVILVLLKKTSER